MKTICLIITLILSQALAAQRKIELRKHIDEHQTINISEVAENVRYIQLETTEECLLSEDLQVYYNGEYIFIADQKTD